MYLILVFRLIYYFYLSDQFDEKPATSDAKRKKNSRTVSEYFFLSAGKDEERVKHSYFALEGISENDRHSQR